MDKYPDRVTTERIFSLWLRYHDAIGKSCEAVDKMSHTTGLEFLRFHREADSWRFEARRLRNEVLRLF